jgi:RNA polymerase sigma-70 factor (sigma-E family)
VRCVDTTERRNRETEALVTFDDWARARLPALVRFAVALTGDRGLAEDVVQEVLIRAYGRWSRIASLDQPEAYLRRMVTNEYLSWRRRWARITPHADVTAVAEVGGDEDRDHAEAHADRAALAAELARLPKRQRAVLVLRYYEHLTDAEIADVLGCPQGTVRSLASRALHALRVDSQTRLLMGDRP